MKNGNLWGLNKPHAPRLSRYKSDSDEQERKPNTRKERINMTNAQNVEAIIAQLTEEEQKLSSAYEEAEERNNHAYEKVLIWEEAYTASGNNEAIGQKLDEAYDDYNEADRAMWETEDKLKSIKEAIEALRKAVEAIKWLGL